MGLLKRGDEFDQKSIFWQIIFPESSDVSLYSLESFASSTTLLSHTGALLFLRQPRSQLDLTGCCSIQISHQFSIIRNLLQSVLSSPYYSYYLPCSIFSMTVIIIQCNIKFFVTCFFPPECHLHHSRELFKMYSLGCTHGTQ